jgi:hypothetical protein
MDICLLWVSCVVRYKSLRRADHSSRGVLPLGTPSKEPFSVTGWVRIDLSKGSTRLGAFLSWRQQQNRLSKAFHKKISRWTVPKKKEKVPEIHIPPSEPPELTYVSFTYLTFFETTVTRCSSVGIQAARACHFEDFGLESQQRQKILLFSHLPKSL